MSGMAIRYDEAVLDKDQKHARFGGGRTIHGGLRGICHLDGFRSDLSKHLFTSPAGPPTHCEQRETYLQVRGSSRYSAAEYKGVGNKRMTKNERDRRKDMPALTAGDIFMGGHAGLSS